MKPAVILHYFFQDTFGTPTRITIQLTPGMILFAASIAVATSILTDTRRSHVASFVKRG